MPALSVEHPHGLRLIALCAGEEPIEWFARLVLVRGGACAGEALRARLRRYERGQVSELLCLKRDELIAGLSRLKGTDGRLAGGYERIGLGARSIKVLNDTGLNPQGILMRGK